MLRRALTFLLRVAYVVYSVANSVQVELVSLSLGVGFGKFGFFRDWRNQKNLQYDHQSTLRSDVLKENRDGIQ